MNGNSKLDTNSDKNSWTEIGVKALDVFEKLTVHVIKVEGLTPVGKMNFCCAIGVIIITIIQTIMGKTQDSTLLIVFSFLILLIMSILMASKSFEIQKHKNIIKKL